MLRVEHPAQPAPVGRAGPGSQLLVDVPSEVGKERQHEWCAGADPGCVGKAGLDPIQFDVGGRDLVVGTLRCVVHTCLLGYN